MCKVQSEFIELLWGNQIQLSGYLGLAPRHLGISLYFPILGIESYLKPADSELPNMRTPENILTSDGIL